MKVTAEEAKRVLGFAKGLDSKFPPIGGANLIPLVNRLAETVQALYKEEVKSAS